MRGFDPAHSAKKAIEFVGEFRGAKNAFENLDLTIVSRELQGDFFSGKNCSPELLSMNLQLRSAKLKLAGICQGSSMFILEPHPLEIGCGEFLTRPNNIVFETKLSHELNHFVDNAMGFEVKYLAKTKPPFYKRALSSVLGALFIHTNLFQGNLALKALDAIRELNKISKRGALKQIIEGRAKLVELHYLLAESKKEEHANLRSFFEKQVAHCRLDYYPQALNFMEKISDALGSPKLALDATFELLPTMKELKHPERYLARLADSARAKP